MQLHKGKPAGMPCCIKILILCGCFQNKAGNTVDPWNYLVPIWIRKVGFFANWFRQFSDFVLLIVCV